MEDQIVSSQVEKRLPRQKKKGPGVADIARVRQRENLLLSRTRVMHDLDQAQNPRYQKVLREALAHLDGEIAQLS